MDRINHLIIFDEYGILVAPESISKMFSRDNFEMKRICNFLRNHEIPDPSNYNDFYREGLEDYSDFSLEDPGVSETSSGLRTFDSSVPAIQKCKKATRALKDSNKPRRRLHRQGNLRL